MRSKAKTVIAATLAAGLTLGTANTAFAAVDQLHESSIEPEIEISGWCPTPTPTPTKTPKPTPTPTPTKTPKPTPTPTPTKTPKP
ncbi:hypothetical protein, partial [Paenibacillus bouchesdurhonensis]|uniref:hypothetical protein n=1 Tax=Paenibacillus bouchesdurhonensis TaxID=1870990 RepID=UPI001901CE9A